MAPASQVMAAPPTAAPSGLNECKPATANIIYLCWTAATAGADAGIQSYIIYNATETCSGSGDSFTCSFGEGTSIHYRVSFNTGLNQTGGTLPGSYTTTTADSATGSATKGQAKSAGDGLGHGGGTGSNVPIANFTGLQPGAIYKFIVQAESNHGLSANSTAFQLGTLFGDSVDWSLRPAQEFGNGTSFGASTEFAADQDFTNFQNFGANQVFGSGTGFAEDQTFNGTQNFSAASIGFDSGTQFSTKQDFGTGANFTGATTFTGANTFGEGATFGKGANFKDGVQVFGASGNFSGVFEMIAGNTFGAATTFATDQPFVGLQDFSAANMKFGSGTTFDTVQSFGTGMNFTGSSTFTGANVFGVNAIFGDASVFPASQEFGKGVNFTGKMTFSGTQKFPLDTMFAAGQEFAEGTAFTFDDHAIFKTGTDFGASRDFDPGTMFDSVMTFYAGTTFDSATKFGDKQDFTAAMTFGPSMMFGAGSDFTALAQTFSEGTSFGPDTTFAVGQELPLNTVPDYGMLLETFTCSDAACVAPSSAYLPPGGLLAPGKDPAAISSSLTTTDPSVSITGLGFIMNFTTVGANGNTSVDPIDPLLIPDSTGGTGADGSRGVTVGSAEYQTIGTALDVSAGTATVSGDITIQLPYKTSNIPSGLTESDLVVLHYVDQPDGTSEWESVSDCTVDSSGSTISCTVTSLSPFSVGTVGSSSSGAGGGSCDTNGFGPGKSLALYEITWDILESNEVSVIAGSTCGPIELRVFTQHSIASGGLSMEQPYLAENKVVLEAPLNIPASDSFRVVLDNNWNSFEQTIYPELQGSSGTILLDFQEAQYGNVKLFLDEEPQLASVPSSGVDLPEPQLAMEAIDHIIMRQNYDSEPQLDTWDEYFLLQAEMKDSESQLTTEQEPQQTTEQEGQMGFWDWLFSLFF